MVWNFVFCRGKNSKREIGSLKVGTTRGGESIYTNGWEESVDALLIKFFPTVEELVMVSPGRDKMEVTTDQVEATIWSLKQKKAPGLEGLNGRMVRSLWNAIPEWIHRLFALIVDEGNFPREWKTANLVILLKGADKDKTSLGSYRPISLISVLGKTMERLMVNRLQEVLKENPHSNFQFGYTPGVSTEDAWNRVDGLVRDSVFRFVLAIAVDFTSAFDVVG